MELRAYNGRVGLRPPKGPKTREKGWSEGINKGAQRARNRAKTGCSDVGPDTPLFYPSKSNNDAIMTIPAPNNDKILTTKGGENPPFAG